MAIFNHTYVTNIFENWGEIMIKYQLHPDFMMPWFFLAKTHRGGKSHPRGLAKKVAVPRASSQGPSGAPGQLMVGSWVR